MKNFKFFKNKRGWIEILEAFFAVMLVTVFLIIFLNNSDNSEDDFSYEVFQIQSSILREVQTNESLRTEIASAPEPLPIGWDDSRFPTNLKNKIIERTPEYLECVGKICPSPEMCNLEQETDRNIYSHFVTIATTIGEGEVYRKLNLFCWTK